MNYKIRIHTIIILYAYHISGTTENFSFQANRFCLDSPIWENMSHLQNLKQNLKQNRVPRSPIFEYTYAKTSPPCYFWAWNSGELCECLLSWDKMRYRMRWVKFLSTNNDFFRELSRKKTIVNKVLIVINASLHYFWKLNVRKSTVQAPGAFSTWFLNFAAIHNARCIFLLLNLKNTYYSSFFYAHITSSSTLVKNESKTNKKLYGTRDPFLKNINHVLRSITQTNVYSKNMEDFLLNKIYNQVYQS